MKEFIDARYEWAPVLAGAHYKVKIQSRESPRDTYEYEFDLR